MKQSMTKRFCVLTYLDQYEPGYQWFETQEEAVSVYMSRPKYERANGSAVLLKRLDVAASYTVTDEVQDE